MVDLTEITKQLTGAIGLYPAIGAGGDLVAGYHREPVMYLSDAHKLLRPEVLSALGPNLEQERAQPYAADVSFYRYDVVADATGAFYESLTNGNLNNDLSNTAYWKPTTGLSAWYSRIERGAIAKLGLLASSNPASTPLLDNQQLFAREGNRSDTLNKQNRFLGWRIYVNGNDTAVEIVRAAMQLTGNVANLPIYLFHSTQDTPIAVFPISGQTTGRSLWADVEKYLYQRIGGYYLIGYYESDLPDGVFAVGALRSFTVAGCGGCGGGVDAYLIQSRAPYVAFQPIYVPGPVTPGIMDWDEIGEIQVAAQSWGLNLVISVKCDATKAIINNKELLTQALLYMIACDVLEYLSTNDRVNIVAKNMTSQAYVALNGQAGGTDKGLKGERQTAINDLKTAFSQISACTPTKARTGISFTDAFA